MRLDDMLAASSAIDLAVQVAQLGQLALKEGGAAVEEFNALADKLKLFQAENRDPTADEFRALQAETNALTSRLDAAAARFG